MKLVAEVLILVNLPMDRIKLKGYREIRLGERLPLHYRWKYRDKEDIFLTLCDDDYSNSRIRKSDKSRYLIFIKK